MDLAPHSTDMDTLTSGKRKNRPVIKYWVIFIFSSDQLTQY